jgi:hypothetical protein
MGQKNGYKHARVYALLFLFSNSTLSDTDLACEMDASICAALQNYLDNICTYLQQQQRQLLYRLLNLGGFKK